MGLENRQYPSDSMNGTELCITGLENCITPLMHGVQRPGKQTVRSPRGWCSKQSTVSLRP